MIVSQQFLKSDPKLFGSKALVYIGEKVLVYRRDGNTNFMPHTIDLPGGGAEQGESAFDTLVREIKEEFGLVVGLQNIVYTKKYESTLEPGLYAWFVVVKLPEKFEYNITFGDEGEDYFLITIEDFIERNDAWSLLQERAREFLANVA